MERKPLWNVFLNISQAAFYLAAPQRPRFEHQVAKVEQGARPGPNTGGCAADLRTGSHRQLDVDTGCQVREFQGPREARQGRKETTVTAARALNGGDGPPVS